MFQILEELWRIEYLSIPPFAASTFRQPVLESMVGPSMLVFSASVVAPLRIDLFTPNSSHKFTMRGMIPMVFC
jgi:hypothetical protein